MAEPRRTLPDYQEPPVTETVLGVQFLPLKPFSTRLFGLYRELIKGDFPHFEIQDPIAQMTEEFGAKPLRPPGIQILSAPDFRCWYIDESETRLIQVQKDRFIHNWRKVKDEDVYPHYDNIKPNFQKEWLRFCDFLKGRGIDHPEVNQCEVTYVNHIGLGQGWASYAELSKVISCWSGTYSGKFLPGAESVAITVQYVLPDKRGRLHVTMRPAIRQKDAKEVLQLNLTARGKPNKPELEEILSWFDLAHEWIVCGFTDFTTKHMHDVWRRTI